MSQSFSPQEGLLELSMLNAEVKEQDFTETMVELLNRNIPTEIVTRLKELWEATKTLAGEVIRIGKIIVQKIVDFVRANPNLVVGLALGAAVSSLVGMVPLIGPALQPIATVIGSIYGAGVGSQMDSGQPVDPLVAGAIKLAKEFFELLASIFNAVKEYWITN